MCSSCSVVHLNHCFHVLHMALRTRQRLGLQCYMPVVNWTKPERCTLRRPTSLTFQSRRLRLPQRLQPASQWPGPATLEQRQRPSPEECRGTGPPLANVSGFPFSATPYQSVGRAEYVPLRPVQSCVPAAGGPRERLQLVHCYLIRRPVIPPIDCHRVGRVDCKVDEDCSRCQRPHWEPVRHPHMRIERTPGPRSFVRTVTKKPLGPEGHSESS